MKRILIIVALIAGCASGPKSDMSTTDVPVGQQPTSTDERVRAKAHADLGLLYFQNGQVNIALEEARLAIVSDPSYALGYNLSALIHMFLGDDAIAQTMFDKAVSLAPNDPEINNNYGWFLCQAGREQEGIKRLDIAARHRLATAPTRSFFNAGLCSLRLKNEQAAEEYFRRAVFADSTNAAAIYQLANLAYGRGSLGDARRYLSEFHRLIDPTAESVWLGLRIERKMGDRNAEASYASQLRRKFQDSPEYQAFVQGKFE